MKIFKHLLLFAFASLVNASLLDTEITFQKFTSNPNPVLIKSLNVSFGYGVTAITACPSLVSGVLRDVNPLGSTNPDFTIWTTSNDCVHESSIVEKFYFGNAQFQLKESSGKTIYMRVTSIQNDSLKFHATFSFYEKPLSVSPKKSSLTSKNLNTEKLNPGYDILGRSVLNSLRCFTSRLRSMPAKVN